MEQGCKRHAGEKGGFKEEVTFSRSLKTENLEEEQELSRTNR